MDGRDWQCGECGTLLPGTDTRRCPTCGGINFYPVSDEVPGGEGGSVELEGDILREAGLLDGDGD
ncbi:MAG: hypothetical protein R3324_01140 [Halobacteriales archaeon]|nr:hypothetical protein [Halobacteriales archaeon]